jgi:hypothetical protein
MISTAQACSLYDASAMMEDAWKWCLEMISGFALIPVSDLLPPILPIRFVSGGGGERREGEDLISIFEFFQRIFLYTIPPVSITPYEALLLFIHAVNLSRQYKKNVEFISSLLKFIIFIVNFEFFLSCFILFLEKKCEERSNKQLLLIPSTLLTIFHYHLPPCLLQPQPRDHPEIY